jgi:exonuclease VII large subunit
MLGRELQSLISEILSQSPKQILSKGFALISAKGHVVTSAAKAAEQTNLTIEFHDGLVSVEKVSEVINVTTEL